MRNKRLLSYVSIFLTAVLVLSVILSITHAQTSEDEIAQLEQDIADSGYGWLSNYNGVENE